MRSATLLLAALLAGAPLATSGVCQNATVVVGSKNFTESCLLAELMAQMLETHSDLKVERRINLGGTKICWSALLAGEIDMYADYTGTAWAILLKEPGKVTDPLRAYLHVSRACLQKFHVHWLLPFGLDNTYALAMNEDKAEKLGIRRISDLVAHAGKLSAGFSVEFMNRADGYPGLSRAYDLHLGHVRSLEHGLAYTAIRAGDIDLVDAYRTDGKLLRYPLRVLEDDRHFFPPYNAAPIVREATLKSHPEIRPALAPLGFAISSDTMQALNYIVEADKCEFADVARAFLERKGLVEGEDPRARVARQALDQVLEHGAHTDQETRPKNESRLGERALELLGLAIQHLGLTLAAVALATAVAVPLGIVITRREKLRTFMLGLAGVVQTIPSLALLAFMIPLLGLGVRSAITALFLYAVLPILRNTYTGIAEVDPDLIEAARGMGLRDGEILRRVQLPLATRTIMAGIRTSTVISIGVATLAAFIGAGGLGQPIVTGLYLNNSVMILSGAIPAACLAIAADAGLGVLERRLTPAGLA